MGCVDIRFLKPLDEELLHEFFQKYETIITVEDGTTVGGLGESITSFAAINNYQKKIKPLGVPDVFPEHGTVEELQKQVGISSEEIHKTIQNYL